MALPQLSNNTPSAGYISWTAFGMRYGDADYSIAAGSTNKKFVYWAYNGGVNPSIVATDTLPSALAPEDYFLFLNKLGIGMFVDSAQVIDGSMIVNESIYAGAIAADQINATHIATDAVTAEHIGAGVIEAEHIGAGAITAEKLSVGTVSDNMVINGSFEDAISGNLVGFEAYTLTSGTIIPVTGVSSSGATSIRFQPSSTTCNLRMRQLPAQYIPVSSASGRRMYVSARMGVGGTATTAGTWLRVNWYDANKVILSSGGTSDVRSNGGIANTFTIYEGQVTPPAAARYMGLEVIHQNPNITSELFVDELTVHEVTMSAQIGDGQITAAKILAGTITADRIAASAITADKILVTDQTNYWENPDFEGDTVGQRARGTTGGNTRVIASGAKSSGKSMEIDALNGSNDDVYGLNQIPVEPGDKWLVRADYKFLNTAGTGPAGVGFQTFNALKANVTWTRVVDTASTALTNLFTARPTTWSDSGWFVYTVPAGTYFIKPWVTFGNNLETTNRFHVDNIIMRRMNGGELIVDGAITAAKIDTDAVKANHIDAGAVLTEHMTANTILGDRIMANTLAADRIVANSITAGQIATDAITADAIAATAIDGKTITGATIRTADPALAGARVVMDETGLKAWDANNKQYLTADGTGLTMTGKVIAEGMTEGSTPQPIQAIMGTWQEGYTGNEPPGVHFKRMDRAEPTFFPRVYSFAGESLTMASGSDPALTGSNDESMLMLFPYGATLSGHDEVTVRSDAPPGGEYGYMKIHNGSADGLTPASVKVHHTGGFIELWSYDQHITLKAETDVVLDPGLSGAVKVAGKLEVDGTPQLAPVSTGTARDAIPNSSVDGASVVRTDLGGITQRRIDGKWSGFAGSVAYVTVQNGYSNYARGYPTTHAYMGPDGRTYLGGMFGITSTGSVSILANNLYTMGTLPVGYRPPYPVQVNPAVCFDLGITNVYIATDGTIQYRISAAKTLSNGNSQFWISLEGISWRNTNC